MDLNELLLKARASGQPEMFDTVLKTAIWKAEEDYRQRHARPHSQAELLKKYGAVCIADLGEPGPDSHLIRDFVAENEPCYFYGARGSLKSYKATMVAVGIASEELTHIFGREIEKHGAVIIFDSEMNERRYNQRIRALCRGLKIDVPRNLIYKNVVGVPPSQSFSELHEMIGVFEAVAVVIDSLGFATRSKPEDYAEQRDDATERIDPIIKLGCTPIIVDHKPHQGDHLFGSVAKEYHGRGIFQVKDLDEGNRPTPGERRTRIVNEKLSHGPDGWGIDVVTTFEMHDDGETGKPVLDEVTMKATDVAGGGFVRGGKTDSRVLVKAALEEGDKTRLEIAEHSGLSERTLEKLLPKMEDEGSIRRVNKGKDGALIYGLVRPDEGSNGAEITPRSPTPRDTGAGGDPNRLPSDTPTTSSKRVALLTHGHVNRELAKTHNLIYRRKDVPEVLEWLKDLDEVALDTETYGVGRTTDARKKARLSFVKGKIRLIQLSDGNKTYLIDALLLKRLAVVDILEALRGKTIVGHNLIFDLPRLRRHYDVNLLDEGVADTIVVSRLVHAGEWEENGDEDAVTIRHRLGEVLRREGVADIPKETDHEWEEPLTDERLGYATDDVRYLPELYGRLYGSVEERGLSGPYELYRRVYRMYVHTQYDGQPIDERRLERYTKKLEEKVGEARAKIEEHKPPHPDGGEWSWGNKQAFDPDKARRKFEAGERKTDRCPGRNGARRALEETGVKLKNLRKPTRIAYLKKHPGKSPLLEALNDYYLYSDLLSDSRDWLNHFVEGGRIYANVNPFGQVTGRSAYSNPALQNSPKEPDPGIGISLRDCIRAPEGYTLVKADYAAQELRILAEITGDEDLIGAFAAGEKDPHVLVGEKVAGHDLDEEKDPEEYARYRKLGKRANYGFSYGQGAERYQTSVFEDTYERIPLKQARDEQEAFRKTWPGVSKWQKGFGDRTGTRDEDWYTTSFLGRRRYVGRKWDKRNGHYKPDYCDRLNGPIQSGGADMLYTALSYLLEDQESGLHEDVKIIITTHDEIVLEAPSEDAESVKGWLKDTMVRAARRFLREELAGEDSVEVEGVPSWGGQ